VKRLSNAEKALFLVPILFVPIALIGQKWKVVSTPLPTPAPKPIPTPTPNLYANFYTQAGAVLPSSDGRTIHTGEQLGKPKFQTWDARSGNLIRRFGVFRFGNADGILSPNGKILGFGHGGWDGNRVVLFDTATGKEKLQVEKPRVHVGHGFDLHNNVLALPAKDDVRLYNTQTGKPLFKLQHRARDFYPSEPRFSRDGRQLLWIGLTNRSFESYANGNSSDEIVWFDLTRRKRLHAVQFPQCDINVARFSGDGKVILVTGLRRHWVKYQAKKSDVAADALYIGIDARTGKIIYTKTAGELPNDVAVSPDGRWFTFSVKPRSNFPALLGVYDVKSGKLQHRVDTRVSDAHAWSADSKTLYIAKSSMWKLTLQQDNKWKLDKGRWGD